MTQGFLILNLAGFSSLPLFGVDVTTSLDSSLIASLILFGTLRVFSSLPAMDLLLLLHVIGAMGAKIISGKRKSVGNVLVYWCKDSHNLLSNTFMKSFLKLLNWEIYAFMIFCSLKFILPLNFSFNVCFISAHKPFMSKDFSVFLFYLFYYKKLSYLWYFMNMMHYRKITVLHGLVVLYA